MQTKVKLSKRVVSLATALVTGMSAVGAAGIPGGVFEILSASAEDGHNYVNGFCTDEGCTSPYAAGDRRKWVHITSQTPEISTGLRAGERLCRF